MHDVTHILGILAGLRTAKRLQYDVRTTFDSEFGMLRVSRGDYEELGVGRPETSVHALGESAETKIPHLRPLSAAGAPVRASSAPASPRTTWSNFLGPPTPTSYGEVLSISPPVARNMPNAASDIVQPSLVSDHA